MAEGQKEAYMHNRNERGRGRAICNTLKEQLTKKKAIELTQEGIGVVHARVCVRGIGYNLLLLVGAYVRALCACL